MVGVELTNTLDRTQIIGGRSSRGHLSLPASGRLRNASPSSFRILLLVLSAPTWFFPDVLGAAPSWLLY